MAVAHCTTLCSCCTTHPRRATKLCNSRLSCLPCVAVSQVVNCVGLVNYKFFLQFLVYTFVATLVAIACLIQPMLVFFSGTPAASGR
jgi:palmitoyltransferase